MIWTILLAFGFIGGVFYIMMWNIHGISPYMMLVGYMGVKRSLDFRLKRGYLIKPEDMTWRWSKTDYGDWQTRWRLVNSIERNSETIDIYIDGSGNIVKLDDYDKRKLNAALLTPMQ